MKRNKGSTTIAEILIVIIVIGILAFTAFSQRSDTAPIEVRAMLTRICSDMLLLRSMGVSSHSDAGFVVNTGNQTLTAFIGAPGDAPPNAPSTTTPMVIHLADLGIEIGSITGAGEAYE